jgi:hypothetical protein
MVMRRTLGPLLLAVLLTTGLAAGCGNGDGTATDRSGSSSTPTGTASPETIGLFGQSAAGGRVDAHATVLDDDAAVAAFTRQFRTDAVRHRIEAAISKAHLSSRQTVVGAVVSIGCDVPPGVDVQGTGDALTITPKEVASPLEECLVPVTTVALVAVDSGAV